MFYLEDLLPDCWGDEEPVIAELAGLSVKPAFR